MEELTTVLAAVSLAAWVWLLTARNRFWRGSEMLDDTDAAPASWPSVVAVIPARDEAELIGRALRSIAGQDYPAQLSVVVVDDESDDGTAEAARAAGVGVTLDVVSGASLPTGWTGKLWALEQGIARAGATTPDAAFIWLTDADIEHDPDVLRRLVARAEIGRLDLVSTMVMLKCGSAWERLLIPAFVFFFQKLYPFPRVNDPRARIAAAAGGCILLRRAALMRIGGIAAIRNELIDDCALAREIKKSALARETKNAGSIWLGLSRSSRSLRDYRNLGDIWHMVARTAFHQLGYSTLLLAGTVIAMAVIYLAPPLIVVLWPVHGIGWAALFAAAAYLLMMIAFAPTLRLYDRGPAAALALPVAAAFYVAMTVDSARRHWRGHGGSWKARHYVPQG